MTVQCQLPDFTSGSALLNSQIDLHFQSREANAVSNLNKEAVAQSFSRAAATYESAAALQQRIAQRLLALNSLPQNTIARLIDLGCATGYFTQVLANQFTESEVFGVDIAEGMIAYAKEHYQQSNLQWCCADAQTLPFSNASVDLIFSSFALQWCPDMEQAFAECFRLLRNNGYLVLSLPGPGTLKELESSWTSVDGNEHVNQFASLQFVVEILKNVGFTSVSFLTESIELKFNSVKELAKELKALGAHNVNSGRAKSLTGKSAFKTMMSSYEQYRRQDGLLPATYEVIYVKAAR